MPTRRTVLGILASGVTAAALPVAALAGEGNDSSYDISYIWAPELSAVLDYRDQVSAALGPAVTRDLVVVRGRSGNWGLIYDRAGSDLHIARRVARAHDRLLRESLGGSETLATVVRDEGYSRSHNIRYGEPTRFTAARHRFDTVEEVLGPDILRGLVIEEPEPGRFAVVYKRHGDAASTASVAARHRRLLADRAISTHVIAERHRTPVWGPGSGDQVTTTANVAAPGRAAGSGSAMPSLAAAMTSARAASEILSRNTPTPEPQPSAPSSDPVALPAAVDTPIRDALNAHVQALRRKGLIAADETTSWYVHALTDDRTWVAINAERSLQCASMMKPYVALAFLHRAHQGELIYGPVSKAKLEAMIQRSNNAATNWAMAKVGGPRAVQRLLDTHYPKLVAETRIVEAIPANGRTYKNRSSARDYVRFCRAMWRGEIAHAAEIKRLMGLPKRDRLVTSCPSFPAGTRVHNKTGSTSHLCGDFGVIVPRDREGNPVPYAFVGIIEKRSRAGNYAAWITARSRVIRSVSDLTYRQLRSAYDLA